ncbi:hypothetical protein [Bernardetia litoralis]|nr:hypothetical protein [Bernardetia litoralis]
MIKIQVLISDSYQKNVILARNGKVTISQRTNVFEIICIFVCIEMSFP